MLADRYELDHEIGRGGMGSVWLGRDTVLRRTVAIKQIGMAPGGGAPDLVRAEREARLAARVNHHNVVAVFDLVIEDGQQWLVMEHVEGPSLSALITERGTIGTDELAPMIQQVAGALAAAHAHGIVHRDVKPSNILLTHDGIAKLSDFGVARAQADASLTKTGLVTGSPGYLSPEVVTGRPATAASDVWSLGATVFHALAGHPPYEIGDNLLGMMHRIVDEEPPRLDGGGRLVHLVASMMQREPDARPTMTEIERTLAESTVLDVPDEPAADLESTQGFVAFADDTQPAPTSTTAFAPLDAPAVTRSPAPTLANRVSPRRVWLAAGAVAVVFAVITYVVISGGDDADPDAPASGATSGQADTPATEEGTTAEAIEGFTADYLTEASNDPEAGFAMLTTGFQQESGGLEGYTGFWGGVSGLDVQSVQGDPDSLTVSYTYAYDYNGKRRTEDVTLQLEESGDSFLISGEA